MMITDLKIKKIIIEHFGSDITTATVSLSQVLSMVQQCLKLEREAIASWLKEDVDLEGVIFGGDDVSAVLSELAKQLRGKCDHHWISIINEVIENGSMCTKCNAVKNENTPLEE